MEIGNGEQHNALPSFCNKCTGASKKYCFLKEALAHSLNSFIVTKTISDWHLEKAGFVLFLLPSDDFVFYESFPVNCSYVQSSLYLVVYSPFCWSVDHSTHTTTVKFVETDIFSHVYLKNTILNKQESAIFIRNVLLFDQ